MGCTYPEVPRFTAHVNWSAELAHSPTGLNDYGKANPVLTPVTLSFNLPECRAADIQKPQARSLVLWCMWPITAL